MSYLHITVPQPPPDRSLRQMSVEERQEASRQRDKRCEALRNRVRTLLREGDAPGATITVVGSAALYVMGLSEEARSSLASTLTAEDIPCCHYDGDDALRFDAHEPVSPSGETAVARESDAERCDGISSPSRHREPRREYPRAVEAVEVRLGIGAYIEAHKAQIYGSLERAYLTYRDERDAALLFIADVIPLVSGIVNFDENGSSVAQFRAAVAWAKTCVPNADHAAFLTTLTLIYILEKGRNEFADDADEEKRVMWNRMAEAVLLQMQYV